MTAPIPTEACLVYADGTSTEIKVGWLPPCPDIPEFLKIPAADRAAAWKGRTLTVQGSGFRHKPTKVEEAATRQLRLELEAAEKAKRDERFAMLRELNEQKRRAK